MDFDRGHFIPYTEDEVGANGRFDSRFMADYLKGKKLSKMAQAVLDEGRKLWKIYHSTQFERKIRDEFMLNRPDVGWYQIRRALEANSDNLPVDMTAFKKAYEHLGDKLRPQVVELGFLK